MSKYFLVCVALCCTALSTHAGNLDPYIMGPMPHPFCGLNSNFPSPPSLPEGAPAGTKLPNGIPFKFCRSLIPGFSANKDPLHPGKNALIELIAAIGNAGFEEKVMKPMSPPLTCKITPPIGLIPMNPPQDSKPECTRSALQSFLDDYERKPEVRDFRKFHSLVDRMNLNDPTCVAKLKQARSVLILSNGKATFGELVQVLE